MENLYLGTCERQTSFLEILENRKKRPIDIIQLALENIHFNLTDHVTGRNKNYEMAF
jgi:hypothetical protein